MVPKHKRARFGGLLETIDAVDRQALFSKMQEVLQFGEMPPEEEKQPTEAEKKALQQWLNSQLTGEAAKALAEKLERFEWQRGLPQGSIFWRIRPPTWIHS